MRGDNQQLEQFYVQEYWVSAAYLKIQVCLSAKNLLLKSDHIFGVCGRIWMVLTSFPSDFLRWLHFWYHLYWTLGNTAAISDTMAKFLHKK